MTDREKLKLSQQLVMTPQLQLAIRLLGTPTRELGAVLESWLAEHPGAVEELPIGALDPGDEAERAGVADIDVEPWFYPADGDEPLSSEGTDVWIWGNPPRARSTPRGAPRWVIVATEPDAKRAAAWLVRALRMRAKTYERVVGDVLVQRPNLATALDPTFLPAVKIRDIAERIGMHESTITRVAGAVQFRTLHGLWAFEVAKGKLSVRNCAR
jgi:hypothetical protein